MPKMSVTCDWYNAPTDNSNYIDKETATYPPSVYTVNLDEFWRYCPKCGWIWANAQWKYCPYCGSRLDEDC